MEQDLIKKKDLLKKAGITYGQLYRWKRRGLIPEEWFIKKACPTGQETYLPRREVLERIAQIKQMKNKLSLEEMAERFSPCFKEITLDHKLLIKHNIVTLRTINYLYEHFGTVFALHLENVLYGYMLEKLVTEGLIDYDEERKFLLILKDIFTVEFGRNYEIVITRRLGTASCFVVSPISELFFDRQTKLVARLNVAAYKEKFINILSEAGII